MKDLINALQKADDAYTGAYPDVYVLGAAKGYLDSMIDANPDKAYTAKEVLSLLEFLSSIDD